MNRSSQFVGFHPLWQFVASSCVITLTAVMMFENVDMRWTIVLYIGVFSAMCSVSWGRWK